MSASRAARRANDQRAGSGPERRFRLAFKGFDRRAVDRFVDDVTINGYQPLPHFRYTMRGYDPGEVEAWAEAQK